MKKNLFTILAIALLLIVPSKVMAATIEIGQEDLEAAQASGSTPTDKGLTYTSGTGFGAYYLSTGEYRLTEDLTIDGKIFVVTSDETVTFDFNGKTINVTNPATVNYSPYPVLLSDGILTVTGDGKMIFTDTYYQELVGNGKTTIENGTFQSVSLNGEAIINGGTFKNTGNGAPLNLCGDITINGGTFTANGASSVYFYDIDNEYNPQEKYTLTINGGTFTSTYDNGIEIMGGKAININGGTFSGGVSGIALSNDTVVTLKGGKFSATSEDETLVKGGITVYDKTVDITKYLASGYEFSPKIETTTKDISETYTVIYTQKEVLVQKISEDYTILNGDNQTYVVSEGKELVVRASGDIAKFTKLLVDGNELSSEYYTVESGSTIAKIKSSYLSTLSDGTHELTFVYTNGQVSTKFAITANSTEASTTPTTTSATETASKAEATKIEAATNPQTEDNIITYTFIFGLSLIGLVEIIKYNKKQILNN